MKSHGSAFVIEHRGSFLSLNRGWSRAFPLARCQKHSQRQPGDQSCDAGKDDPRSTAGFDGVLSRDTLGNGAVCSIGDHCHGRSLAAGLFHQIEVVLQRLVDLGVLDPGQGPYVVTIFFSPVSALSQRAFAIGTSGFKATLMPRSASKLIVGPIACSHVVVPDCMEELRIAS